jgi:hypothetical protein
VFKVLLRIASKYFNLQDFSPGIYPVVREASKLKFNHPGMRKISKEMNSTC